MWKKKKTSFGGGENVLLEKKDQKGIVIWKMEWELLEAAKYLPKHFLIQVQG